MGRTEVTEKTQTRLERAPNCFPGGRLLGRGRNVVPRPKG